MGIVGGLRVELWPGHDDVVNRVQKCKTGEAGRQGQRFLVPLFCTTGMKVQDGPHEHTHSLHSRQGACGALPPTARWCWQSPCHWHSAPYNVVLWPTLGLSHPWPRCIVPKRERNMRCANTDTSVRSWGSRALIPCAVTVRCLRACSGRLPTYSDCRHIGCIHCLIAGWMQGFREPSVQGQ